MFGFVKDMRSDYKPTDLIEDLNLENNYQCHFNICSSDKSYGLQLVDILLWLAKKFLDSPFSIKGKCMELINYIGANGYITEISENRQREEVINNYIAIMSIPFTKEELSNAKKNCMIIEEIRQNRMSSE